ncbi:uncharacterized protein [Drosophila virilis]|uniref:Uncharacterized protein n=1 Tax=Drosophila virilis TaxID=7244 RepID=A0A0Q9WP11_DROVI|nr:uncharacterized protein LOC26531733 [Drosophila virilis]KRF83687.1 uncharacterized protein Dvir_GJ26963 [Drosophila virilis]
MASWEKWVERNAKPKIKFSVPQLPQPPTRWQKPGPMDRQQWIDFHKWAKVNACPLQQRPKRKSRSAPEPTPNLKPDRSIPISPLVFICVASELQAERDRKRELKEKIEILSQPKYKREKYLPPPKREHPYRPQLPYRPPPKPERGRPTEKPKVPCCFQHEELKINFWSNLRFKISPQALKAKPSKKVVELARPRTYPPKLHCPLPANKDEKIPKRKKMSAKQWKDHLMRLDFLSQPNPRVLADLALSFPDLIVGAGLQVGCLCKYCGCPTGKPVYYDLVDE